MTQTVRDASDASGLVIEMRQMVQAGQPAPVIDDPEQLERTVSAKVATRLMAMLVAIIFATSAVPDVGPSLAKAIQAHLYAAGERPADRRVDIDQLHERVAQGRAGATQDLWDGIAKERLAVGKPHDAAGGVMGVKYHTYLVAAVRKRLLRHGSRESGAQRGAAV